MSADTGFDHAVNNRQSKQHSAADALFRWARSKYQGFRDTLDGTLHHARAARRTYEKRRRDQSELERMSNHLLNDIGLTRHDVRELRRTPFYYL